MPNQDLGILILSKTIWLSIEKSYKLRTITKKKDDKREGKPKKEDDIKEGEAHKNRNLPNDKKQNYAT